MHAQLAVLDMALTKCILHAAGPAGTAAPCHAELKVEGGALAVQAAAASLGPSHKVGLQLLGHALLGTCRCEPQARHALSGWPCIAKAPAARVLRALFPQVQDPITEDDYFSKSAEFSAWLLEECRLYAAGKGRLLRGHASWPALAAPAKCHWQHHITSHATLDRTQAHHCTRTSAALQTYPLSKHGSSSMASCRQAALCTKCQQSSNVAGAYQLACFSAVLSAAHTALSAHTALEHVCVCDNQPLL